MRYTVLVVDVLIFFSAAVVYVKVFWCMYINQWIGKDKSSAYEVLSVVIVVIPLRSTSITPHPPHPHTHTQEPHNPELSLKAKLALILLLQPGLILIDYGHFQYNCVSLGLTLWGIIGVISNHYLLGSVAFSLALNYKQMELYHALPFFFFLLGKSFNNQSTSCQFKTKQKVPKEAASAKSKSTIMCRGLINVAKLAIVVTVSFLLLWLPFFLTGGVDSVLQILRRLFPFSRGLYEDKVANFWCSFSVLVKVRQVIPQRLLVMFSTGITLTTALPSSLYLLWRPQAYHFLLALVSGECDIVDNVYGMDF